MSEEDAASEGETHLSSRRAAASHPAQPRRAEAHAGAYAEERQASHHTAGGKCARAQLGPGQPVNVDQDRELSLQQAEGCKACCLAHAHVSFVLHISWH